MRGALNDIGDPDAPMGSPPWCKYVHVELCAKKHEAKTRVSWLKWGLHSFRRDGHYEKLVDREGKSFVSWKYYVEYPEPWGLGMPAELAQALIDETDENALVSDVVERAKRAKVLDAKDRESQRLAGRPKAEILDNKESDVQGFPSGNSAARALRRLRKDRPDIHARVLAGEITAHAGMVEAGFRKRSKSRKQTPLDRIRLLLPKLTDDERAIVHNETAPAGRGRLATALVAKLAPPLPVWLD